MTISATPPRPRPKPKAAPKAAPAFRETLPQHQYPAPFDRLLTFGEEAADDAMNALITALRTAGLKAGIARLVQIASDPTYGEYWEHPDAENDPRAWTRYNALRVLTALGPDATSAIEPLLPLLDDEDDGVREDIPYFYAAVGAPAIEPLAAALRNRDNELFLRTGAGDALQEMGEQHAALRPQIIPILEEALATTEDKTVAAFVVCNLLDVGAKDSLNVIQRAFADRRVDETIVGMADVEEHFGMPITAPRIKWDHINGQPMGLVAPNEDFFAPSHDYPDAAPAAGLDAQTAVPFVKEVKAGRNEPCPCGSGKKYKKCCGQ